MTKELETRQVTRRGTGTRRGGQKSASRILAAARELLVRSGSARFSMREIAAQAGLHLANVQYYYPTRDDLVRALLFDTGRSYRRAYEQCLAVAGEDRVARFRAILEFNLRDLATRATRRYFLQLWALLSTLDRGSGRRLNELYEIDIDQLSERIAEIDPAAPEPVVRRRATLLAAQIEGLMIVHGAHSTNRAERKRLMDEAERLGFAIALGRIADTE